MSRTYSLIRRYDLLTMFVAVSLWCVVLTLFRIFAFSGKGAARFSFLLLVVALAQYLLYPLGRPRTVSIVVGVLYVSAIVSFDTGGPRLQLFLGAFYGYLAGACIAAPPLISDLLRSKGHRSSSQENSTESD